MIINKYILLYIFHGLNIKKYFFYHYNSSIIDIEHTPYYITLTSTYNHGDLLMTNTLIIYIYIYIYILIKYPVNIKRQWVWIIFSPEYMMKII